MITWWTISDVDPWRGMPCGLLDVNGDPKPVYYVLDDLINNKWKTEIRGSFDDSVINMRGFYGSYEIIVNVDGQKYKGLFSISKNKDNFKKILLSKIN